MKRLLPLILVAVSLGGCGLRPLYSGGAQGPVAQSLRNIEVAPIEGKAGWLVRNAINDRLAAVNGATPQYRLIVKLDDDISGFGVRADDAVTSEPSSGSPANGGPCAPGTSWSRSGGTLSCWMRRQALTQASTSPAPNMRPSRRKIPHWSVWPRPSPTRSFPGWRFMRRAAPMASDGRA